MNSAAQADQLKATGRISNGLHAAGCNKDPRERNTRIRIQYGTDNIAGDGAHGSICPTMQCVNHLGGSHDVQHAITNIDIQVRVFIHARRAASYIAILKERPVRDSQFGSIGDRIHRRHLIVHGVQGKPRHFIQNADDQDFVCG